MKEKRTNELYRLFLSFCRHVLTFPLATVPLTWNNREREKKILQCNHCFKMLSAITHTVFPFLLLR